MSKERVDDVERPAEKKSLLERYEIPIESFSYEYITDCKNAKELERIVMILRSGEEGYYPDLTKHAERHLAKIKPGSSVLRYAVPVLKRNLLEPEKRTELDIDMNEWMCEMKLREKDLAEGRAMQINEPIPQPAVREITIEQPETNKQSSQHQKKHKRIGACDYAGWDKYDADTELNRIDIQQEQKQAEAKRIQKRLADKEEKMKKASKEEIIKQLTLTGTELSLMAEKEREKGNEAFRSGDYIEALHFYHASIAIDSTINAYNNRAITYIKLERYDDAVKDCNKVITMECTNIKALLRRGFALERLEKRAQALADYEAVLKLEPSNNIAITALNKLRGPCDSKKIRMKIEEATATNGNSSDVQSSRNTGGENSSRAISKTLGKQKDVIPNGSSVTKFPTNFPNTLQNEKKNSQYIFVQEIPSADYSHMCSEVCFCEKAASSSQYSSPQPHFRGVYCPKVSRDDSKHPKTQSIFTDAKIPYRKSSSVVIEEIPNEPPYVKPKEAKNCKIEKCDPLVYEGERLKGRDTNSTNFQGGDMAKKKSHFLGEKLSQEKPNTNVKVENGEKSDNAISQSLKKCGNCTYSWMSKDIVTTEMSSERASGPIIKEVPNDPCRKSNIILESEKMYSKPKTDRDGVLISKNFESRDNGEIGQKSEILIEKKSSKIDKASAEKENDVKENRKNLEGSTMIPRQMCTDMEMSCEKSLRLNNDENRPVDENQEKSMTYESNDKLGNSGAKCDTVISIISKKEEIGSRPRSPVKRSEEYSEEDWGSHSPTKKKKSAYEFLRLWNSMKNDQDLVLHANFLKALPPESLDTVLGNKLDGDMLSTIISCLERHFCNSVNSKLLLHFLQNLAKVKRFSIVKMFMDAKDEKALEKIFMFLDIQGFPDHIRDLRRVYGTPM